MSLADRNASPLHLAIIDLDHFKQVNDQYGHAAGDEVLCRFSELASQGLRRSDLLARYGGEEFVVLFPHASRQACMAALERLRERFSDQDFGFSDAIKTSFSAGLAAYHSGESAESFTHRADTALYDAKAAGRNRIILAQE